MIKDIFNSISSSDETASVANKQILSNTDSNEGLFEKLLAGFQKREQHENLLGETQLDDNTEMDDKTEKQSANHVHEISDKRQLNEKLQSQSSNTNTLLVGVIKKDALENEHAEESIQHVLSEDVETLEKPPLELKKIASEEEVDHTREMVFDTSGTEKHINADAVVKEDIVENIVSDNKTENSILAESQPINEEQVSVDIAESSVKVASPLQEINTAEAEAEPEPEPELKNTPKVPILEMGVDQIELDEVAKSETEIEVKNDLKENPSQVNSKINTSATAVSLTQMKEEVLSVLNKNEISNLSTQTESSALKHIPPTSSDTAASQILKQSAGQVELELQQEIAVLKNDDSREKRYSFQSILDGGKDSLMGERLNTVANQRAGIRYESLSSKNQDWLNVQTVDSKSPSLNEEQDAFLQEHSVEMNQTQEGNKSLNENTFARLGELPVANAMLRRSVIPGLVNGITKTASSEKGFTQVWQKHSFDLDDGSKIELSTRNVDGVIQVKLASSSLELSRLLQQYEAEIKEHLEQECDLNIDLQFNDNQNQDNSSLFDDLSNGKKSNETGNLKKLTSQQTEQSLHNNVRQFGYNRMEWTA